MSMLPHVSLDAGENRKSIKNRRWPGRPADHALCRKLAGACLTTGRGSRTLLAERHLELRTVRVAIASDSDNCPGRLRHHKRQQRPAPRMPPWKRRTHSWVWSSYLSNDFSSKQRSGPA
ncbi:MAG: hypothetical protein BJ554DRAFT_5136 [Olpidium bornovanus]|uniref:Uncharacterized protein n=1 Tax=Olpidium bornovanus TaxID=278681 RepID=A0A8H7ZJA1_9FUNG|nr:MAG: hypothetical protein BJ554DRAFT_5136 [Olpidium bornovanus]